MGGCIPWPRSAAFQGQTTAGLRSHPSLTFTSFFGKRFFLHPASFLLQQLTDLGRSGWVWEALWGMLQLRAPCLRCQERGGPVAAVARL